VTVRDKRTIVIGGLIRNDSTDVVQKVPLLGDIPILGLLFRKRATQRTRTNLIVFITPHIITDDTQIEEITQDRKQRQQEFDEGSGKKRK
jgi:general secretion pathway protein D